MTTSTSLRAGIGRGILLFLLWSLGTAVMAAPGDEHWDPQFGAPGPGGVNYAVETHGGRVYVSGFGSSSTNVPLEVWDGVQWSAMSQFYGPGPTVVYDLAFVGNTLYAAGVFTNVDGVAADGLAKWDGHMWSSIGFSGAAYSLAADGSDLYVGGYFTNAGGVTMKNIGRWDGSSWHALGDGLGDTNYSAIYAVTAINGSVYAGGYFTNSGSTPISTDIAYWNGSGWSSLGAGPGGPVYALALNGTGLYAGGLWGTSGVAKWDGANWTMLGSGFDSQVSSLAAFNNLICAAGAFTTAGGGSASHFAVWNGSAWLPAGSGLSGTGFRMHATATRVYVVGNFLLAGGKLMNGLASWDGTNWSPVGTPGRLNGLSSSVRAIAGDGTNVYVGGSFTVAGPALVNHIARFDGSRWFPLGAGLGGSSSPAVYAIAVSNNDVYVGGSFTSTGGVAVQNIARWDGTNWYGMGNPLGSSAGVIFSITVRTDGVYAAGSGYGTSGYGSPFLSRWDGTNWQGVVNFNPNDTFVQFYINDSVPGMDAAAFEGTNIYVGGHFNLTWHDPTLTQATNCSNILRFDGTYGRIVDTGLNGNVVALAVVGTNLYVAGPFTTAGGLNANQLAKWDGSHWSDVGGSVVGGGTVKALATVGSDLYVGGSFTNLGGVAANHIARWDGTNWSALGSGTFYSPTAGPVYAITGSAADIYVGGVFRQAGDKSSYYIGHWNERVNFDIPRLFNPVLLTNRQFQATLLGFSGVTNIVEASANLSTWTPLLTNSSAEFEFTDPSAPGYPVRFYRAVLQSQ